MEEMELKMVTIVCQHCGNSLTPGSGASFQVVRMCLRCFKWTWVRVEDGILKGSGKVYSRCPGKCKVGKLAPEIREKLDRMLIGGWTYQDIIEQFRAGHLNGANLSTHNNKHLHSYFRSLACRSVASEERCLAKEAEKLRRE